MTDRRKIIHIVPDRVEPQRRAGGWDSIPVFIRKMGPALVISAVLWYGIYLFFKWLLP